MILMPEFLTISGGLLQTMQCFHLHYHLKQLNGTFHFVLVLAVPVDKGGSVSPNVRVTCSLRFTPRREETTSPGGEWAAAPETDLQLAAEATQFQPEQTPAPFGLISVAGINNNY